MFLNELNQHDLDSWSEIAKRKTALDVQAALRSDKIGLNQMAALLSPEAGKSLEQLAKRAREITLNRFGKTIQLYTPVYLSSYCRNCCLYCGFRKTSKINRRIQSQDQIVAEALYLKEKGFKKLLLVSGDDPRVNNDYLKDIISKLHRIIPSISLEIASRSLEEYRQLCNAGADGVVIYQETYNKCYYKKFHIEGEKSDYSLRLESPERIARAGFHRVGIGVLLGLSDPVYEALALFLHTRYLMKNYWQTQITLSLPRMRKAIGSIPPPMPVNDKKFTQLICALRIAFPDAGILLSTREEPKLRDALIKIGITQISAGSRTEPGGYLWPDDKGEQFSVEDRRSPSEISECLKAAGYDPVWKDWEGVLNDTVQSEW